MSTDLISRNVVILPDQDAAAQMQAASEQLVSLETEFTLGPAALPHLSLYQAAYPSVHLPEIEERVGQIASSTQAFEVTLKGFSMFWNTFIFLDAVRSDELTRLHQRLVLVLDPLREGKLLDVHEQIFNDPTIPQALKESIRTYGNPLCGEQERPHVTLTRMRRPESVDVALRALDSVREVPLTFRAQSLWIAEVGPHGTCPRVLREFPLKG